MSWVRSPLAAPIETRVLTSVIPLQRAIAGNSAKLLLRFGRSKVWGCSTTAAMANGAKPSARKIPEQASATKAAGGKCGCQIYASGTLGGKRRRNAQRSRKGARPRRSLQPGKGPGSSHLRLTYRIRAQCLRYTAPRGDPSRFAHSPAHPRSACRSPASGIDSCSTDIASSKT